MPLQGSFEVQAGKVWGFYESPFKYILDAFNRPSGILGISTNGQLWTTLAGTWYVNGSHQAENDNTVTSGVGPYPLTAYDLADINQLGYANVSPGMGVAFSIKDANNWYAVMGYDYDVPYSCGCTTCSGCNTCTFACTNACNAGYCGTYICNTENSNSSVSCSCNILCSYITNVGGYQWSCPNICNYNCTTAADCTNCGTYYYSCGCSTCYNFYYYLTVLQSINGTVYTLSTTTIFQDPSSISVKVNNGTVSYYAYSTNISGIVTQPNGLGTLITSGTLIISGTFGTQIGMVKGPSYYTRGSTISGFYGTGI